MSPRGPWPHLTSALFHPQMQVLLSQVQNSEQLLQTLQGTVSQAQERVQLQMVRALELGQEGEESDGNWLRRARGRWRPPSHVGYSWSWC